MSDEEDLEVIDEDYYAFLNLSKEATPEEITNAYRRLSRIYHPDKHPAEKKKQAEVLFNKTKKAYEVLSDPHKRAIYDNLGVKGLETEGWEVIQRTRTPQEIREEYERLAREQEERRRQQRTNPKGNVTVRINATSLFPVQSYYDEDEDYEYYRESPSLLDVEVSGLSFDMSTEAPLTAKDTAVLAGSVSTSNGTGSGNVVASVRRITSPKGWLEFEVGAGNGLSLATRAYRSLSQRVFCNCGTMAVTKRRPGGLSIQPGLFATLGTQLDKNTLGYLTWKAGAASGMTSKVVRDTQYGSIAGVIHLGVPHSFISLSCTKKYNDGGVKLKGAAQFGTFGGNLEYGVVKKISKFSFLSASMSIGVPSGIILKIKLTRSNQSYNFPIHLCDEIVPSAVFYGTMVPLGCYFAVTRLVIQPYKKRQKLLDLQKQKEQYKSELAEKRREAEASVELMRATYERIVAEEESRKGLVITRALYGRLVGDVDERAPDVVCVTIPLQCLVKDSKLILHENSKVQLPGFFDPCLGEEKQLKVSYLFRGLPHEVTVADAEGLRIPRQSHRVNGT